MWWKDKGRSFFSITPLSKETFTSEEAEGSYSHRDKCIYLTKVKQSPGQVEFTKLNERHREAFRQARRKEVQSLLDNHAITILSLAESREFLKKHPNFVLKSRYVDRWKPGGDGFSVLPEEYDEAWFDPQKHGDLTPRSRWCVVGWQDPQVHEIERSAPTPLTSSIYLFLQLSASRKWNAFVKDAKTAFLQSKPTTRQQKLACRMPATAQSS